MESAVEEIKKKLDIVEFIGSFITLKKAGRNFKAVCPFHQEKTPSFVISPERQIWHCFGACQQGGDVVGFLMRWENIGYIDAIKELARKTGVKIETDRFEDQNQKTREKLLAINSLAAEYFNFMLEKTNYGKRGLAYLDSRKINKQIVHAFQIGYAPNSWDSLFKFLMKKGYRAQEILQSGLLVRNDRGHYYDRFRGRLIFPLKDHRGNIVGFSGRILEGKSEAKYINTPETPIYHKRETLFGINIAKDAIKKTGVVLLVEGELDMISPFQAGIENVVAIKGSAVTKEQLVFLKRYADKIILALDSDAAGEEAMKRAIEEAEGMDFDLGVITFDYAKDPDEAIRNNPDEFKKIVKNPIPVYDFIIAIAQKKYPKNDPFDKKKFAGEVCPFLEKIQNPIVQSHYIKKVSQLLSVSENSVINLIRDTRRKKKIKTPATSRLLPQNKIPHEELVQKYVLSRLFQSPDPFKTADVIFSVVNKDDFFIPSNIKIVELFLDYKTKSSVFNLAAFTSTLPTPLRSVFDELFLFASLGLSPEEESLTKLVYEIKKISLKKQLSMREEKEEIKKITRELNEVEKRASSL